MKELRWPVVSAAIMTALLAAGCGSGTGAATSAASSPAASTPTASAVTPAGPPRMPVLRGEILAALRHATSVHVSGSGVSGGSSGSVSADLSITRSGHLSGSISEGKASLDVLVTGGHSYFKVSGALLTLMKAPSAACSLLCGKWLILSAKEAQGFTNAVTWSHVIGSFTSGLSSHTLTYRGKATVDGRAAWKLVSSDGTTLYVDAQGVPYLLRAITTKTGSAGQADFTQWDSATIAPAPPASKVVNISQLGG